jgi:ubiquinone/menaquinone biosynthesis C-methylase UbiE
LGALRAAYDRLAPVYAAANAAVPPEIIRATRWFSARLRAGALILDLGCGPGRDMAWMESHGGRVVGVDLSRQMLRLARRSVRGGLAQMDAAHLGFADGAFDGVWCDAVLLHFARAQVPALLAEIHRVLEPEGLLFVSVQEGQGEGWEASRYDPAVSRFLARYRLNEMAALLRAAGFTICMSNVDRSTSFPWLHFMAVAAHNDTDDRCADGSGEAESE